MSESASMTAVLNTEPHFSSEAQEVFTAGCRVFAVLPTHVVNAGAEGVYLGRSLHGAYVGWDTPSGTPYHESVSFASIRNLYR